MGNKNLKRDIKNFNVNNIDEDTFGESLFACIANTKNNCKRLNSKVRKMASVYFIPWVNTTEQYDEIMETMAVKAELVTLYKLFVDWSKRLDEKKKKLFVAYYIKNDKYLARKIANMADYRLRILLPMARSFMEYLEKKANLTKEELIRNPFVYRFYIAALSINLGVKKRRRRLFNKGGQNIYDDSTDERCYYPCV